MKLIHLLLCTVTTYIMHSAPKILTISKHCEVPQIFAMILYILAGCAEFPRNLADQSLLCNL